LSACSFAGRRREIAELLQALVDKHPHERVFVAWDNSGTHQDEEIEAVLRAAAGRLVLLYLPTYNPWLDPIEMLWRQWRREVTHCELFASLQALLAATKDFFLGNSHIKLKSILLERYKTKRLVLHCRLCHGRTLISQFTPMLTGRVSSLNLDTDTVWLCACTPAVLRVTFLTLPPGIPAARR
jgi:putative transposase